MVAWRNCPVKTWFYIPQYILHGAYTCVMYTGNLYHWMPSNLQYKLVEGVSIKRFYTMKSNIVCPLSYSPVLRMQSIFGYMMHSLQITGFSLLCSTFIL